MQITMYLLQIMYMCTLNSPLRRDLWELYTNWVSILPYLLYGKYKCILIQGTLDEFKTNAFLGLLEISLCLREISCINEQGHFIYTMYAGCIILVSFKTEEYYQKQSVLNIQYNLSGVSPFGTQKLFVSKRRCHR